MTHQKNQSNLQSSSKRIIQSLDKDLLKDVLGGAGSLGSSPASPAKSLRRSVSAPARPTGNVEPASPTVDTPNNHPLQSVRIHPYPPKVQIRHDRAIVDGITRLWR